MPKQHRPLLAALLVTVGLLWLLSASGLFAQGLTDLAKRIWPLALVVWGLDFVALRLPPDVRRPARIATPALVVVVGGAVTLAVYTARAQESSQAQQLTFAPAYEGATNVGIEIDLRLSSLDLSVWEQPEPEQILAGEFVGGAETIFVTDYARASDTGDLIIRETSRSLLPPLEALGAGALRVELSPAKPVRDLIISGRSKDVTIDLRGATVAHVAARLNGGNLTLFLPAHGTIVGELASRWGDVTLVTPRSMAVHIDVQEGLGGISYPRALDRLGRILESEGFNESPDQAFLTIESVLGLVSIQ